MTTMDAHALGTDPHAAYSAMCAAGAVCRTDLPDGMPVWLVTRHAEARTALTDSRLSKSARHAAPELRPYLDRMFENAALGATMFTSDPPEHTRLRKLVGKTFTPRRIERLRPRIREICEELLTTIAPDGTADLVRSYAQIVPATVIAELLGISAADRGEFLEFVHFPSDLNVTDTAGQVAACWLGLDRYFRKLVALRRKEPGDDLVSAMLAVRDGEDRLSDREIRTMAFLLFIAGFETTVNLIANGLFTLLSRPQHLTDLRTDGELPLSVIDELLRYDSPVKLIVYRYATEDFLLEGRRIRTGDCVMIAVDAANHDPRRFPDPGVFDAGRDAAGHVAFGHGRHFCLGAPLARLEAQVAIGTALQTLGGLALAVPPQELQWHPSVLVRRLTSLPVTFTPAPA